MDINARHTKLCTELGYLTAQEAAIQKRKPELLAEIALLERMAAELRSAPRPGAGPENAE